jgi:NAD(P)-dependent dehydrogenase (short-subunit alcohol dehydrogenase family)
MEIDGKIAIVTGAGGGGQGRAVALRLITDESLNGRVLVWWNGEPPGLIPEGDAGYAALEAF